MGSCSVGSNVISNPPSVLNSTSNGVVFDEMQDINTTPANVTDNRTAGGDAFTLASSCNKQNSLIASQVSEKKDFFFVFLGFLTLLIFLVIDVLYFCCLFSFFFF